MIIEPSLPENSGRSLDKSGVTEASRLAGAASARHSRPRMSALAAMGFSYPGWPADRKSAIGTTSIKTGQPAGL
jgi:hypothetical protein